MTAATTELDGQGEPVEAGGRSRGRLIGPLLAWTAVLVIGWAIVLTLGAPLDTATDELATAMHPATPVTEAGASAAAAAIVQLQFQELQGLTPTVRHATDFGRDRWVVVYARSNPVAGVRISIDTVSGEVRVTTFP